MADIMAKKTDNQFADELERKKRESTGQLLFKAARLFDEEAVRRQKEKGIKGLRPAHTRLLPHIDLDGTRLTDLAERTGISKQAVGQLVADLEGMGLLKRVADPGDGRARLVTFTDSGKKGLLGGLSLLSNLEEEISEKVGKKRIKELRETLTSIVEVLTLTDEK